MITFSLRFWNSSVINILIDRNLLTTNKRMYCEIVCRLYLIKFQSFNIVAVNSLFTHKQYQYSQVWCFAKHRGIQRSSAHVSRMLLMWYTGWDLTYGIVDSGLTNVMHTQIQRLLFWFIYAIWSIDRFLWEANNLVFFLFHFFFCLVKLRVKSNNGLFGPLREKLCVTSSFEEGTSTAPI